MNEIFRTFLNYFQAPQHYFWQWSENGEVIEWINGSTICYRDELVNILDGLTEYGAPSLGVILFILSACQDKWNEKTIYHSILNSSIEKIVVRNALISTIDKSARFDTGGKLLKNNLSQTIELLDMITGLPEKFRSGNAKVQLISEIFKNQKLYIPSENVKELRDGLGSGKLDSFIQRDEEEISYTSFSNDLQQIKKALEEFSDTKSLELMLKTGIAKLPEKIDIEIPEKTQVNLLDELASDRKTIGISQLTKNLIAAIDFPLHSKGSSEQALGGISDIINRGNLDRLLLSELAQDDLLLTARLVNNEALYYRREEPPSHPIRNRTVLIDTTIKMWGINRVFAVSAALACNQNNKNNSYINNYTLGSDNFQQVTLSDKEGVIDLLQILDSGLDGYKALDKFMQKNTVTSTDYILITGEDVFKSKAFQTVFSQLKNKLNFLITVNRNGQLQFYEFINERAKLLSNSKFNLDELLFKLPKKNNIVHDLPAFLKCPVNPLYFPTPGMRLSPSNVFYNLNIGVIAITEQQIVLDWLDKHSGARESVNYIENGDYCFGSDEKNYISILVHNNDKTLLKLYKFFADEEVEIVDFSNQISNILETAFNTNDFYLRTSDEIIKINCYEETITKEPYTIIPELFSEYKRRQQYQYFGDVKRIIYQGYTTLKKARDVFINASGQISLGNYSIILKNSILLKKNEAFYDDSISYKTEPEIIYLLDNPNIKFYKTAWQDGSEAVIDSRGLLHLKSSDPTIPEITIVMVIGKTNKGLACWASDGVVYGNPYFYNLYPDTIVDNDFYKNYIQRFIDKLIY